MESFATLPTGVRLHYAEQGPRDGTPVIFLHGVTDSLHSFDGVRPLLPRGIRAFALSQRGHGDSSRPTWGYSFTNMSEDLLAFMDAMGLHTAVIVGHSMGASVAQRFAIDHGDRVSALVLIGAFASYRDPAFRAFVESSILPLTDPIGETFAREWQLSTLANPMDLGHLEIVVKETLKVPASVWHATFQGFLTTAEFTGELARVLVPVLLVWGDRDTYASGAGQERLLATIPGARLLVYEGIGHAVHWEDPVRFTGDLVNFVAAKAQLVLEPT